jgi:hypothetical protein
VCRYIYLSISLCPSLFLSLSSICSSYLLQGFALSGKFSRDYFTRDGKLKAIQVTLLALPLSSRSCIPVS